MTALTLALSTEQYEQLQTAATQASEPVQRYAHRLLAERVIPKQERQKSNLILEANLLKQQGLYPQAAHKFAAAAELEEGLAEKLLAVDNVDKAFIHHFSALSCWTQASDLHRALQLGETLLQSATLSPPQRVQVAAYVETVQSRMSQWMRQWTPDLVAAD